MAVRSKRSGFERFPRRFRRNLDSLKTGQITITITAPRGVVEQDILTVEIKPDKTIGDLKSLIEFYTSVPPIKQGLFFNGQELRNDAATLEQCQVKDNDMLGMLVRNSGGQAGGARVSRQEQARGSPQAGSNQGRQTTSGGPGPDAEMTRLRALAEPDFLKVIRSFNPDLADAVNDRDRFRQVYDALMQETRERQAEEHRQIALLNEDPFNVEAQAKIEELIRQQRVQENLQHAMDYTPEVFARVHMLYIDVEVNNNKVKAFVDSGAQATIMSPGCAERCGIMRLIDRRYAGIAKGVGTANILGRVHSAQIKIGSLHLACSFTVMEGKDVDLLLGLDMLKRHQACINLEKGKLIIKDVEVPFLGEADIPKDQEILATEPTVEGPGGMKTGAISGAVSGPKQENFKGQGRTVGDPAGPSSQSRSSASAPSAATGPSFPPGDVAKLMEMGFSRDEAINALEIAGGDVEGAAGLLFG